MKTPGLSWVDSSGLSGVKRLTINAPKGTYDIKLHFCEPENITARKRIFDVSLQGRKVLSNFDIAKTSGGKLIGVVKEFKSIKISEPLEIIFNAKAGKAIISGIEFVRTSK